MVAVEAVLIAALAELQLVAVKALSVLSGPEVLVHSHQLVREIYK